MLNGFLEMVRSERCKSMFSQGTHVNLIELSNEGAFKRVFTIYLQTLASIQPRTSLSKFATNYPEVRIKNRKNIGIWGVTRFASGISLLDYAYLGSAMSVRSPGLHIRSTSNPWLHTSIFGPFSAVSTPIFATKYSFLSIFRDLQDVHSFAPLQSQQFSICSSIVVSKKM